MPLSEYEQRVLEQMERELTSDDPRLATSMKTTSQRSSVRYVIAGVGLIVGLLALVVGVAQSVPVVGVVGFAVMFAAVAYAFAQPSKSSGPVGVVSPDGTVRPAAKQQKTKRGGKAGKAPFMQRMEERWDKRRDEQ
ncbi:DUF3040 domain-containing protein [Sanguibacter inulinus]|uniref:DUF3040 domain-containing protein n=1 Tax=Sanguibacter inulinus TaxID=60922 RepID=A0A853EV06_9MICO|nr:DUF3040 domain-containing protein [Sanguibacter inulinus]MBF0723290.1 DUF3040 domain-containing protein [Sanguibacter inulinus]NYS94435.1 DUF3040 domain-containing protein [Sanguibacter inulinus]